MWPDVQRMQFVTFTLSLSTGSMSPVLHYQPSEWVFIHSFSKYGLSMIYQKPSWNREVLLEMFLRWTHSCSLGVEVPAILCHLVMPVGFYPLVPHANSFHVFCWSLMAAED